jgi:hypothetical protein
MGWNGAKENCSGVSSAQWYETFTNDTLLFGYILVVKGE